MTQSQSIASAGREFAELEARIAALSAELQESQAELSKARKMEAVANLTGDMAHDFNNLLGIIIANLDLLAEQLKSDPESAVLVQEALAAALRSADLLRQLLVFAHRQPRPPEPIDLNEMLARISKVLGLAFGESVEIKLDLGEAAWPVIADPAQLEASLVNIISNSRNAMPAGGVLTIATGNRSLDNGGYGVGRRGVAPGDYALIEVSDTGNGVSPEATAQIFDPSVANREQGKRSGLGLGMVFAFAEQCGAHIDVYSEVGVGTTFQLYLPRAAGEADAIVPKAVPAENHGSRETILAVDDNAGVRREVVRQLRDLGYRILEAEDGPAALMILNSEPVDLLFTDVVMPGGMSGYDLARLVLSRWPAMKALITSGFPELEPDGDSATAAKLRRLIKPYRQADLANALREVLDN